jgi:glutamine synthetase
VIAAILSAGLDGIHRKIEPQLPADYNLYESDAAVQCLPGSLQSALSFLEKSHLLRERLGDSTVDFLVESRKREWSDYVETTGDPGSSDITSWELDRYLFAN